MSKKIVASFVPLLLAFGCTAATQPDRSVSYEFFAVSDTLSATLLNPDQDSKESAAGLFPWQEHAKDDDGNDMITVSNNCGFANYEYRGISLRSLRERDGSDPMEYPLETIVATGEIGEWCQLASQIIDRDKLLATRSWNSGLYILGAADLYFDDMNRGYVIDRFFVDRWLRTELFKPISGAGDQDSCWSARHMTADEKAKADRNGYKRFGENYCAVTGVYLKDVAEALDEPI